MSSAEKGRIKYGFPERLKEARDVMLKQYGLREKMRELKLFPEGLDQFIKKNGGKYEFINLPNGLKSLEGKLLPWELNGRDGKPLIRPLDLIHPSNLRHMYVSPWPARKLFYSEIMLRAVELGADALIKYEPIVEGKNIIEKGIPIKRIGGFVLK